MLYSSARFWMDRARGRFRGKPSCREAEVSVMCNTSMLLRSREQLVEAVNVLKEAHEVLEQRENGEKCWDGMSEATAGVYLEMGVRKRREVAGKGEAGTTVFQQKNLKIKDEREFWISRRRPSIFILVWATRPKLPRPTISWEYSTALYGLVRGTRARQAIG